MGTTTEFITYLQDTFPSSIEITYKKMFGEYGIYSDEKMIALACDNQLFIKDRPPTREQFSSYLLEGLPFPGAKAYFILDFEKMSQTELENLLTLLIEITPLPKKKKKKPSK